MFKIFKQYIHNNLLALDKSASAFTGGDDRETISSRLGKAQRGDFGLKWKVRLYPIILLTNIAFYFIENEWNHCQRNIQDDVGDRELLLK